MSSEDSWKTRVVIRPEGCASGSGGVTVTTEGGQGCSGGCCSVTLCAGPHHTLTLTCSPNKPSREVASQTSSSLIPHLLNQFQPRLDTGCEGKHVARPGERKNPRTVHIDVYCTESSDSQQSSPQTVFESDKVKVVHERKGGQELPRVLSRGGRRVDMSSGYPSKASTVGWSEGTSVWSSGASFDYANSSDRVRIAEKERQWAACASSDNYTDEEEDEEEETSSTTSSTSDSSGPEMAWTFTDYNIPSGVPSLRRADTTIHKPQTASMPVLSSSLPKTSLPRRILSPEPSTLDKLRDKFGTVIRRTNRHVGPAKNPNCNCDTCRYHRAVDS